MLNQRIKPQSLPFAILELNTEPVLLYLKLNQLNHNRKNIAILQQGNADLPLLPRSDLNLQRDKIEDIGMQWMINAQQAFLQSMTNRPYGLNARYKMDRKLHNGVLPEKLKLLIMKVN